MTQPPLALPPTASWLPGRIIADTTLLRTENTCVTFDDIDVYPVGLIVRVTVRLRGPFTRSELRELHQQASGYHHDGPDHAGPHLRFHWRESDAEPWAASPHHVSDAMPWAPAGANGLWRLPFWISTPPSSMLTPLEFSWAARDIPTLPLEIPAGDLVAAAQRANRLWDAPEPTGDHYTGIIRGG